MKQNAIIVSEHRIRFNRNNFAPRSSLDIEALRTKKRYSFGSVGVYICFTNAGLNIININK